MDRLPSPLPPPSWRKPAGILAILALIAIWGGGMVMVSEAFGPLPWWALILFFMITGLIWIAPLKPLLVWMEGGSKR